MSLILQKSFTEALLRTFLQACSPDLIEDICLASASNIRTLSFAAIRIVKDKLIPLSIRLLKYKSLMSYNALSHLQVAIAPHKRIPPEILLETFKYFRPTGKAKNLHGLCIPANTQQECLLLRQVCHRWRVVAMDCLPLWSTVLLGVNLMSGSQETRAICMKRVEFARAIVAHRGAVNIAIDARSGFGPSLAPYAINQLVKPLAARISNLILTAPFSSCLYLLQFDGSQFPSLRHLELDVSHISEGPRAFAETSQHSHVKPTMLMCSPCLQRITISCWNLLLHAVPLELIPWAHLTKFSLRQPINLERTATERGHRQAVTHKQLLPFMVQAANLTSFAVTPGLGLDSEPWDNKHVLLPNLRSLAVEATSYKDWDIFRSITAGPNLRFLGALCINYNDLEDIPFAYITSFVERSSCQQSLLSFHVSPPQHTFNPFYEVDSGYLEDISQFMPNLTTLRIPMVLDETSIDRISQGLLLRNLRTLWCRFFGDPMDIISSLEIRFDAGAAAAFGCQQLQDVCCFDDECYGYSFDLEAVTADISSQYGVNFQLHALSPNIERYL